MLQHADLWRAIDGLAQRHCLSPSGLARKAGLSPTLFNPCKRESGKRKRWPSTESIAAILRATGSSLEDFSALISPSDVRRTKFSVLGSVEAAQDNYFDEQGCPTGASWDEATFPASSDPQAFMLDIVGKAGEPLYREGTRVILSPAEKLRRGDRVVVRVVGGEILFKELGREGVQKVELLSFHPDEPPLTLPRKEIAWIYRLVWASQ